MTNRLTRVKYTDWLGWNGVGVGGGGCGPNGFFGWFIELLPSECSFGSKKGKKNSINGFWLLCVSIFLDLSIFP